MKTQDPESLEGGGVAEKPRPCIAKYRHKKQEYKTCHDYLLCKRRHSSYP